MEAIVQKKVWESEDVFSLYLSVAQPMTMLPGQFVMVEAKGMKKRSYSVISFENTTIQLGIKKLSGTSAYLSTLEKGGTLEITGPYGRFTPKEAREAILIAGGIGVTPIIALSEHYRERQAKMTVLYSSRSMFPFAQRLPGARLFDTVTGRRITIDDIPKASCPVFICGPRPMIESLRESLIKREHPDDLIFSEAFT